MNAQSFSAPLEITELFANFDRPWHIAGGWAIDLYLGRVRRPHKDLDIAIYREDQLFLQQYLADWDLKKIVDAKFEPWLQGEWLELPIFQIAIQVGDDGYPSLEVLLNESAGDVWQFRRNPQVTRPKELVGTRSALGVPFLSPEIVLLFKSLHVYHLHANNPDHAHYADLKVNDEADFQAVRGILEDERREWLKWAIEACYPGHQWAGQL